MTKEEAIEQINKITFWILKKHSKLGDLKYKGNESQHPYRQAWVALDEAKENIEKFNQ